MVASNRGLTRIFIARAGLFCLLIGLLVIRSLG